MNTNKRLNDILNKFPKKTELNKIELSVADDLQKALADAKIMMDNIEKFISDIKADNQLNDALDKEIKARIKTSMKLLNSTDSFEKKIQSASDNLENALFKADNAAKELGVKPEAINGFKEADRLSSKLMKETLGDFAEKYFKGYDWMI
jgi:DNA repair ATPase RecN